MTKLPQFAIDYLEELKGQAAEIREKMGFVKATADDIMISFCDDLTNTITNFNAELDEYFADENNVITFMRAILNGYELEGKADD
ncbi:hypothetical protein ACPBEI_00800 [Latilactobacillus sakei]